MSEAVAWDQGFMASHNIERGGGPNDPSEIPSHLLEQMRYWNPYRPEYSEDPISSEPSYPVRKIFVLCRQCGKEYHARACGPTHALIDHQITLTRFNIKYEVRRAHSGWTCFFETPSVGFTGSGVYFDAEEKATMWGREEWANRLAHAVKEHDRKTAERLRQDIEDL